MAPVDRGPALPAKRGEVTAPAAPEQADDGATASVTPQAARRKPPTVGRSRPTRKLRPGDLVCGQCGEGNPPVRKFCSRCGHTLQEAEVAKDKWWRKLIPRRKPKVLKAGERPGQGSVPARRQRNLKAMVRPIRTVLSIVLLLLTVVYSAYEPFRSFVNERFTTIKDDVVGIFVPQYAPANPNGAVASSETPEHPGRDAVDGVTNSFWLVPPGEGTPTLVVTFSEPTDIRRAIIRNGATSEFQQHDRARSLHLVFDTDRTTDVELDDTPEPQEKGISNGSGVTRIEIQVDGRYPALQGDGSVAITEIELFTEK
ncbi:MAG: zinc ribbon domain-containing protein [Acidimicrobiia bacterium]